MFKCVQRVRPWLAFAKGGRQGKSYNQTRGLSARPMALASLLTTACFTAHSSQRSAPQALIEEPGLELSVERFRVVEEFLNRFGSDTEKRAFAEHLL